MVGPFCMFLQPAMMDVLLSFITHVPGISIFFSGKLWGGGGIELFDGSRHLFQYSTSNFSKAFALKAFSRLSGPMVD